MQNQPKKSDLANRFEALLNECTPSVMARGEMYSSTKVGGSPCQAFSQAGKREGLRLARG